MSMSEAVEQKRLRNVHPAEAACDEHDYVQPFDHGNPADSLIERVRQDTAHDMNQASPTSTDTASLTTTDTADEDDQVEPRNEDIDAECVTDHANRETLNAVATGPDNVAGDQSCIKDEFDGFEDTDER